jgi:N-acetylglucosamine-6-phosphate deacetylase
MEGQMSLKGRIVTASGIEEGFVTIEKELIIEAGKPVPGSPVRDIGSYYIVPGFIDLHMHGIHHFLVDNGPGELVEICRALPKYGVTGFLPTLAPRPRGKDADFLSTLAAVQTDGASVLGFHLEGPFLKITGSLTADAISGADMDRVRSLKEAANPFRAIFSISPDLNGIEELIPFMAAGDSPVFITHTAASVGQTQRAIELGAKHATHFYDVFPCPDVSEPGVRPCGAVEAILADELVSVDFILDGVHVDPVAVKMALACKSQGPGCVCLITDSNVGTGLEPGRYVFGNSGEIEFAFKGAPARLTKNQLLAGSGLTMIQALRNAADWLNIGLPQAVSLVSTNPAKVIGLGNRKGLIHPGYDADLVVLDHQLNVVQTWIGGNLFYEHGKTFI